MFSTKSTRFGEHRFSQQDEPVVSFRSGIASTVRGYHDNKPKLTGR